MPKSAPLPGSPLTSLSNDHLLGYLIFYAFYIQIVKTKMLHMYQHFHSQIPNLVVDIANDSLLLTAPPASP